MEHILVMHHENRRVGAEQRNGTLRRYRALRDMSNPFQDPNFRGIYRLTPDMALSLLDNIRERFPKTTRPYAIALELKFLSALHFYAQGSYQKPDGRDFSFCMSQASVCRAITETTNVLNSWPVLSQWIKFPNANVIESTIQKNYRNLKLPGVLGYVDGTHVLIKKPAIHEELYVNRKGQHSMNVQVVCDSDLIILNILAKYPGSTHDAFIWRASALRSKMMEISATTACWLLGDSGYPLEPWLLTPVLNALENSPEARYTQIHIKARNCVERCFGVLKGRFRCLHKHRTLEYAPVKAGRIINACAVLHNFCITSGLALEENTELDEEDQPDQPVENVQEGTRQDSDVRNRGVQIRNDVINRLI